MKRQRVSRGHHWVSSDVHVDVTDGVKREKKTQDLTSCLFALSCFHKKTPSCSDDEEQHGMELRTLIGRHLQLRPPYQLADGCDEAEIPGAGYEICCGSGAEDPPTAVKNKPFAVLFRKPFDKVFMTTATGFLTMQPISSFPDTDARFLKRDYILSDGQYAATFMNLKTMRYVAVSQDSQVHLCQLAGDPQSCRHPCLFIIRKTGTTELFPTETPEKYLGYRGSMVEVTDHMSSFYMVPASTVAQLADHRDHAVRVYELNAASWRVEPDWSTEDFDMASDYHRDTNTATASHTAGSMAVSLATDCHLDGHWQTRCRIAWEHY